MFNAALFFSAAALLFNPVVGWPTVFPRQGNGTTGGNETDPSEIGTPSPPPSQGVSFDMISVCIFLKYFTFQNVTVGGVLLCEAIHWQSCNYTVLPVNECLDMKQVWNRSISSIGPDNGTVVIPFRLFTLNSLNL